MVTRYSLIKKQTTSQLLMPLTRIGYVAGMFLLPHPNQYLNF